MKNRFLRRLSLSKSTPNFFRLFSTNNLKKSRLLIIALSLLFVSFSISPFSGMESPASVHSVAAAANSTSISLPLIIQGSPTTYSNIFLPFLMKGMPQTISSVFGAELYTVDSKGGLDQMAAAGMYWARRNAVLWSDLQPTEASAIDWSVLEGQGGLASELQNASSKGIQVILIVRSTPEWARKYNGTGPTCGPIAENKLPAFADFMSALVKRYSVAPYNVKYWELWNEEDIAPSTFQGGDSQFGCWGDDSDSNYGGGYYAKMLQAVYPQVKAADPQSQVLIGGLLLDCDPRGSPSTCTLVHPTYQNPDLPPKFLEGILSGGGGPFFDGVSFHAYDVYDGALGQYGITNWNTAWNSTGPTLIAKAGFINDLLNTYGYSGKFLVDSETGLLCETCTSDSTFETTKAYYVAEDYAAAKAVGLQANIWYSVFGWRNSGLLENNLNPLPAYTAFHFGQRELGGTTFTREITDYAGVKGYEFNGGDHRIWILWSLDGNVYPVSLPATPRAAWDALGVSEIIAPSMDIGLDPIYLEWNP